MAQSIFDRTALLLGDEAMYRMANARVLLFGVGGVGSWCAEALVRSGISNLTIVDMDDVSITNINRQLLATTASVGRVKVEVMKERLLLINPDANITAIHNVYNEETASMFNLSEYDYVIDAIDSLKDKALLILNATKEKGIKFFSSMGAALKMDPTQISVAEFWDAKGCPLARALRKKFKQSKTYPARDFKCVYSPELLDNASVSDEVCDYKAQINGSMAHITGTFGFTLAGLVLQDIYKKATSSTKGE
ncbi:MAG: tRNA threonylcarbamoyladenosine dehydratase [Bacteroidales bacterium]|nr:tRNA threonylcarbamoyladenosine dehydratase [Bacteroidales bacterium]